MSDIACKYVNRLIDKLESMPNSNIIDFLEVKKAIYWAKKYHAGQYRKSGEPFYSHPLEVAYMIVDYNVSTLLIVGSILHDIIEDTEVTVGMIVDNFGWRVAQIVYLLTRDRPGGKKLTIEEILNNAYEAGDKDALLIKLVDRMHNMQTLEYMETEKQKKMAEETMHYITAFATVFDSLEIETRLTQLAFSVIYKDKAEFMLNKRYGLLS